MRTHHLVGLIALVTFIPSGCSFSGSLGGPARCPSPCCPTTVGEPAVVPPTPVGGNPNPVSIPCEPIAVPDRPAAVSPSNPG